tara:strand:+ start:724 stop:834 length:111 start_codon:yes stop_codon:yes gene_type:complete
MNGVVSVKCEDCKAVYVPTGQLYCQQCIEKQIEEEE